jgi:hypothetical protein
MTKNLENLEELRRLLDKAFIYLNDAEYSWEEGTLTECSENMVLDAIENITEVIAQIDEDIDQIKEIRDKVIREEDAKVFDKQFEDLENVLENYEIKTSGFNDAFNLEDINTGYVQAENQPKGLCKEVDKGFDNEHSRESDYWEYWD